MMVLMNDSDIKHVRITIAITTFRRPAQLATLLATVNDRVAELPGHIEARLVVVDNDPDASARPVVASFAGETGHLTVAYEHETMPGIAAARQRALESASGTDAVVFLDDDVVPLVGWLPELVNAWHTYSADAVMGYVKYEWPAEASAWIAAGGFMRRDAVPTGTRLPTFATGNALIDIRSVQRLKLRFDRALGLSGGEDSLFGLQLVTRGGTIVSCLESVVLDEVPVERTTREFVKRRSISHGQGRVRMRLHSEHGKFRRARVRAVALVGGRVRLVAFFALHMVGELTRNVSRDAVGMRRTWFALGMVQQSVGHTTDEYARSS